MSINEIMDDIKKGLTGNTKEDINYLKIMQEKYKNTEKAGEISIAIGKLMCNLIPQNNKKVIFNNKEEFNEKLSIAEKLIDNKETEQAYDILQRIVEECEKIENNSLVENEDKAIYFSFRDSLDFCVYIHKNHPKKEVKQTQYNFDKVYLMYGYILIELNRLNDAEKYLNKALNSNPLNTDIMFELSEIYKIKQDMDKYVEITKQALSYARSNKELARSYRNIGYYFIQKEKYTEAICAYYLSGSFEKNDNISKELYYILENTDIKIAKPSLKKIRKILRKHHIQIGASDYILGMAYVIAEDLKRDNERNQAKFYYNIVYELTSDEAIKEIIDKL